MLYNSDLVMLSAAAICLICGGILLLWSKQSSQLSRQSKKERMAKASFRVRKSNLLAISGRGSNQKGYRSKKWNSKRKYDDVEESHMPASWLDRITYLLKEVVLYYFGSLTQRSNNEDKITQKNPPVLNMHSSSLPSKINMDQYYNNVQVVGLDCEMVGGGKGGIKSLLARCSVVTLDCIPIQYDSSSQENYKTKPNNINQNLIVLYDKYVIPKGRITDYRTQWSGITKETFTNTAHSIPIVTFYQCQKEITELFSSIDEKSVMVVGHALENDFDALEIKHPGALTRDTSLYRPYMRQVKRRLFPRKLSTLTSEELGIEIQQEPHLVRDDDGTSNTNSPKEYTITRVGHSSVEDAAAALRLYWHRCQNWERSLRYPLLLPTASTSPVMIWQPIITFYLDCCNLPLGLRGLDFKELLSKKNETTDNIDKVISSKSVRLVSRQSSIGSKSSISTTDWIPYFRSALLPGASPQINRFVIMFDGAKFRDITKARDLTKMRKGSYRNKIRCFSLESPNGHGSIAIEITGDGDSADDALYDYCNRDNTGALSGEIISLTQAADVFSGTNNNNDQLDSYLVIRRKAGGSKSHRRLFDKLHLRRPNEGALFLSGLTSNLQKDSYRTIRELQRSHGVEKVLEFELRRRNDLAHLVVTDDVFLTERLVQLGTVLVLSYRQMESMF